MIQTYHDLTITITQTFTTLFNNFIASQRQKHWDSDNDSDSDSDKRKLLKYLVSTSSKAAHNNNNYDNNENNNNNNNNNRMKPRILTYKSLCLNLKAPNNIIGMSYDHCHYHYYHYHCYYYHYFYYC